MKLPLVINHVTLEQGEKCDFCKEPQTTYITLEQPIRLVLCFRCMPKVVGRFVPSGYVEKFNLAIQSIQEFKGVALETMRKFSKE